VHHAARKIFRKIRKSIIKIYKKRNMKNLTNKELKRITAYVNTKRIHWLVEELQKKGISEIMVTEFFRPNSQISKIEFYCNEEDVDGLKTIVHTIGSSGPADHLLFIKDVDRNSISIFPFV
jgi:hypothetical protein